MYTCFSYIPAVLLITDLWIVHIRESVIRSVEREEKKKETVHKP